METESAPTQPLSDVCCYQNCSRSTPRPKENIRFYRFPCDPKWADLWLTFCHRRDLKHLDVVELNKNYRVCSLHFVPCDYMDKIGGELKSVAYPKSRREIDRWKHLLGDFTDASIHSNIKNSNSRNNEKSHTTVTTERAEILIKDDHDYTRTNEYHFDRPQDNISNLKRDTLFAFSKSKIYVTNNNEIYVVSPEDLTAVQSSPPSPPPPSTVKEKQTSAAPSTFLSIDLPQSSEQPPFLPLFSDKSAIPIKVHTEPLIINNTDNNHSFRQLPIEQINNNSYYDHPAIPKKANDYAAINNNIYVISAVDNLSAGKAYNIVPNLPGTLEAKTATSNIIYDLLEKRTLQPVIISFEEYLQRVHDKINPPMIIDQHKEPYAKLLDYEIVECLFNKQYDELFCRICLKHVEEQNKFELFPKDDEEREATAEVFRMKLNDFSSVTDLELVKNPVVCQTCRIQIEQSYDLKQKAKDTEKYLRNLLINYRHKTVGAEEATVANKLDAVAKTIYKERHRRIRALGLSKLDYSVLRSFKENPNVFDKRYDEYFSIRRTHTNRMIRNCRTIFYSNRFQPPKPWLCEVCGLFYKHDRHRANHQSKVGQPKVYVCDICGITKNNYSLFASHKMMKHRQFNCKYCDDNSDTFQNYTEYMRHIREQHPENCKQYQCDACGETLNTAFKLRDHKRRHLTASIPATTCNDCQQQFKSKKALVKHLKFVHSKVPLNRCKLCERDFWSLLRLKEHLVAKHYIENNENVLNSSIEINLDEETADYPQLDFDEEDDPLETIAAKACYSCNECGREFHQKGRLKRHEETHRNDRGIIACHLCKDVTKSRMRSQDALKRHMRIYHSNDLFNKCVVCLRGFWKFQYLKDHFKRVHDLKIENRHDISKIDEATIEDLRKRLEEQPVKQKNELYPCKVCGKQFRQRGGLYQHSQIHRRDNTADYSCQICKETRNTKNKILSQDSLDKHMKIFHSNEPVNECEICGRGYWNLRLHLHREHKIPLNKIKSSKIIRDPDEEDATVVTATTIESAEDNLELVEEEDDVIYVENMEEESGDDENSYQSAVLVTADSDDDDDDETMYFLEEESQNEVSSQGYDDHQYY